MIGSTVIASLPKLKLELEDFLDITSNFIVIDDIDSLTTKGIEAGRNYVYRLLWRAALEVRSYTEIYPAAECPVRP